jgi:hypothetical protein
LRHVEGMSQLTRDVRCLEARAALLGKASCARGLCKAAEQPRVDRTGTEGGRPPGGLKTSAARRGHLFAHLEGVLGLCAARLALLVALRHADEHRGRLFHRSGHGLKRAPCRARWRGRRGRQVGGSRNTRSQPGSWHRIPGLARGTRLPLTRHSVDVHPCVVARLLQLALRQAHARAGQGRSRLSELQGGCWARRTARARPCTVNWLGYDKCCPPALHSCKRFATPAPSPL